MIAPRRMVAKSEFLRLSTRVSSPPALTLPLVEDRSVRLDVLPAPTWLVVGLVVAVARSEIDALLRIPQSASASWGTRGQG
ncbi:MAG: hypothetical protein HY655_06505 [Acidobacteria bacterium]|nr:hypothetical protein [Acidobacteriota bacterium]